MNVFYTAGRGYSGTHNLRTCKTHRIQCSHLSELFQWQERVYNMSVSLVHLNSPPRTGPGGEKVVSLSLSIHFSYLTFCVSV